MENDYLKELIQKWATKGLLLDTNLFLLFVVGFADIEFIRNHKKTNSYSIADYKFLYQIVSHFRLKLTLPNVQTEVSNLARQTHPDMAKKIGNALQRLFTAWSELYEPSLRLTAGSHYIDYGLTDAALVSLSEKYLLVTADGRLARRLSDLNRDVLNFNHYRPLA